MKMKKAEKLQDAIGMVGDDLVAEAKNAKRRSALIRRMGISAVAACLAVCVIMFAVLNSFAPAVAGTYALALAEYPETPPYNDGSYAWKKARKERLNYANEIDGDALAGFIKKTLPEFLKTGNGENGVYSPLNVYMVLAMMAESAKGNSRKQILDLLCMESIEDLRTNAHALWSLNYINDGKSTCILANSVWLNNNAAFKEQTLEKLSQNYYASVFRGKMGSEEYNEAFRAWLNEQTGGALEEWVNGMEFSPETVMALVSTLYFKAAWEKEFEEIKNTTGTFYTPNGEIECEFMNNTFNIADYYHLDKFRAMSLEFQGCGKMFFVLPDKGYTPEDLLTDGELAELVAFGGKNSAYIDAKIHLSVPKFDISDKTDLKEGLKNLGVTDVFDSSKADFEMRFGKTSYVTDATHDVRVVIDEQGCMAAAASILKLPVGVYKEVNFVLDRPFIFVITGDSGLPLFVGIVNVPV